MAESNHCYSEDTCVICHTTFVDSTEEWVTVGEKGIGTLVSCSKFAGDLELQSYLLSDKHPVNVHVSCRRQYTKRRVNLDDTNVDSDGRQAKRKLRCSEQMFDWKSCCFLCGMSANVDERHPERGQVHAAATLELRNSIVDVCSKRCDSWSIEVQGRLQQCIDFVAAEAVYHRMCNTRFRLGKDKPHMLTSQQPGSKKQTHKAESFLVLCDWLEENTDGELLSVLEWRERMVDTFGEESVYSSKQLKRELNAQYGDHVFFTSLQGRVDVVCLRNMASFILHQKWYTDRKQDINDESIRVVTAAANLIRAEMREKQYTTDAYPTPDEISDPELQKKWIPSLLLLLMTKLVPDEVKQLALGNAVVQAARPRSVLSPLLFGVGVEMDHTFGSKWLVTELSRLGFSVTYDEVVRYKQSVLEDSSNLQSTGAPYPVNFTQFVADNVDHNVATLDGKGTFHGMGIIAVSTRTAQQIEGVKARAIRRLKRRCVRDVVINRGVPILQYNLPERQGLSTLSFDRLCSLMFAHVLPNGVNLDLLWSTGWLFPDTARPKPNWSGFMQHVCTGQHSAVSDVSMLPVIDLNPTDLTCIYSTLVFVEEQAKRLNIATPCITFDQPLWVKAVEVVRAAKLNVVCRLGGFHMIMSFLGSVGSLMSGSGLSDVLELIYGPNAVIHMMHGKAVSRALRGNFLVDAALTVILMKLLLPETDTSQKEGQDWEKLDSTDIASVQAAYDDAIENRCDADEERTSIALLKLDSLLRDVKMQLSHESRTAKLWIQYMYHMETLRMFIRAERSGNWNLHLIAVSRMLNIFAATGHNQYAKCARMYLQMMLELQDTHSWLYEQFMCNGFHTVRRSDRYWSGLWTDLVIEQVLMRSLKSRGGLTHGRGLTESVRLTWIHSMHSCADIHCAMTKLTQLPHTSTDQHWEMGTTRAKRDGADMSKILAWFEVKDPFSRADGRLCCISTGVTAVEGDGINCDMAEEVGASVQKQMDGVGFLDVVLKKANFVKTLQQLHKGVIVEDKMMFLHNTHLFSRLVALVERTNDVAPYFCYEMTPLPAALFKHSQMRKPNKAALGREVTKNAIVTATSCPTTYVLDGGSLLHRVKWPKTGTYGEVLLSYVRYVQKRYGTSAEIVFDGYSNGPSPKDHEHERRAKKTAAEVQVDESKPVCGSQEAFLANAANKSQFIALLGNRLSASGLPVQYAAGDADTLIVSCALQTARQQRPVTVVAEDTDVLLLLVHHLDASMADIFMLSLARSRNAVSKLVNIRAVQNDIGDSAVRQLLVIHALTGCDTTSAIYGRSKAAAFSKIARCSESIPLTEVIAAADATKDGVAHAGKKLMVMLYGGKSSDNLNSLRYTKYMEKIRLSAVLPEKLPPTERAAFYHCLRVHLQVVTWMTLGSTNIEPTEWGWKNEGGRLTPIATDLEPAPEDLLKVIRCNCKSSAANQCFTNLCTCRKNGLHCIAACGNCHGQSCWNAPPPVADCDDDDDDDDVVADEVPDEIADEDVNVVCYDDDLVWEQEETVL